MKNYLLLAIILFTNISFSQISDVAEAQNFWDNNIQAIIRLDADKIISQTKFPLNMLASGDELTAEEFKGKLNQVFTDAVRIDLRGGSISNIDAWVMSEDDSETYMVACTNPSDDYDAVVFLFKEFDGNWLLYGIDYQKED